MRSRVKLWVAVSTVAGMDLFAGGCWGFVVEVLTGRVWAGVAAGVSVSAVLLGWMLGRVRLFPWQKWTVTVWLFDGSKRHYRMSSEEGARQLQAYAVKLGREDEVQVTARVSKGRRGL